MLFRRRKKLSLLERLRLFVWPQKSFARSMRYLGKRVLRLNATPHAIAAGVAAGVAASWTPLIGFHFVLSFALAYVLAGNMIAAGIGTAFGNPLTFPFIWAATFKMGHLILDRGKEEVEHVSINLGDLMSRIDWAHLWQPILKPMLVGCIAPAVLSGLLFYALTFYSVRAFQERRRRLLIEKAAARQTAGAGL
jgi:uncharacterized protein (DUF2062 family)